MTDRTQSIAVKVIPQTEQIASALEIMARHAKACADELRATALPPVGYLFSTGDGKDPGDA